MRLSWWSSSAAVSRATYAPAASWYGNHVVRTGELPSSADEAIDRIIDLVQDFIAVFARTNTRK